MQESLFLLTIPNPYETAIITSTTYQLSEWKKSVGDTLGTPGKKWPKAPKTLKGLYFTIYWVAVFLDHTNWPSMLVFYPEI